MLDESMAFVWARKKNSVLNNNKPGDSIVSNGDPLIHKTGRMDTCAQTFSGENKQTK